jgi:ABC-2 type transport system ATP-binding protein
MNAIETQQLTRVFGKTRAVDSVSMEVPQGTVFGLLGPNGAGKSTLLKLLVGHLRATSGTANVLGRAVTLGDSEIWQRAGYVSQARYLPGWMTAEECLRFAGMVRSRWDQAKVKRLVERFELPVQSRIRDLSRGHYVRLQVALAFGGDPQLVILDEPTSGLDPIGRKELLTLLVEELDPSTGRTVVFSSHLVEDIERMADSAAILDGGRVVANGAIDRLKGSRSRVEFTEAIPEADLAAVPGLITLRRAATGTTAVTSDPENAVQYLRSRGANDAAVHPASLEQVFFEYVNHRRPE